MGESMPVEDRSGLVLFLHHGMLRWIREIGRTDLSKAEHSTRCRRPSDFAASNKNNAVVKIFAAMTLHAGNEKERFA